MLTDAPGDAVSARAQGLVPSLIDPMPEGKATAGEAAALDSSYKGPQLKRQQVPDGAGPFPMSIPLRGDKLILGRKAGADIVLKFKGVSSKHCEFVREGQSYRVRDLGSTNGVRVNGEKVDDALLKPGDTVTLDQLIYVYADPLRQQAGKRSAATAKSARGKTAGASGAAGSAGGSRLIVEAGNFGFKFIPIGATPLTFGRKKDNSHVIEGDTEISGNHAKIARDERGIFVRDLGSTNGVSVNGKRIEGSVRLMHGMVVQVGGTILRVEDPATAGRARAKTSVRKAPTTSARKAVPADPSELRLDGPDDLDDDINETSGRPAVAPPPAEHQELTDDQVAVALSEEEHQFLGHHTRAGKRRVNPFTLFLELFFLLLLVGGVGFLVWGMQTRGPEDLGGEESVRVPAGSLLTLNHSFEDAVDGVIKGWYLEGEPGAGDLASIDNSLAHLGANSLSLQKAQQSYEPATCFNEKLIPTEPGDRLEVSAFVRRSGSEQGAAGLRIDFFGDAEGTELIASDLSELVTEAAEWMEVTGSAVAPEGAKCARVGCAVMGARPRYLFDDVEVRLAERGAPIRELSASKAGFTWTVFPDGSFSLAHGSVPVIARGDVVFASDRLFPALLSQNTIDRELARTATGGIRLSGMLCDAIARNASARVTAYSVTFGFDKRNPTLHFAVDGSSSFQTLGCAFILDALETQRPLSFFTAHEFRSGSNQARDRLEFPDLTHDGERFTRLVLPCEVGPIQMSVKSALGMSSARYETPELRMRVTVGDAGSFELSFTDDMQFAEFDALRAQITSDLEQGKYGQALSNQLRMLTLRLHDPTAIKRIADDVRTIAARFDYLIRDFQDSLERLKSSDSPALYREATERGDELQQILGSALQDVTLDVLDKIQAPALSRYFDAIRSEIARLRAAEHSIASFYTDRKPQIDHSTLTRWEAEASTMMGRAIDFDDAGLDSMAIAAYRELIETYPLCRAATAARRALLEIAMSLKESGDALLAPEDGSPSRPAAAFELQQLAHALAGAILDDTWTPVSTTIETRPFWDDTLGEFATEASEMIKNFLPEPYSPDDDATGDYRIDWRRWGRSGWRDQESNARYAAEALRIELDNIPTLPEPPDRRPDEDD